MKQSNENLASDPATKALMQWLVAAALDNSFVTYGEAKSRLEHEVGFERIARAGRTGMTAGTMINKLLAIDEDAPLLNVLLVERATELPSDGAGGYLARRFEEPKLRAEDAKNRYPKLWRRTFDKAAGEVYATPEAEWRRLYELAFQEPLDPDDIEQERVVRKNGTERDGINNLGGGEGEYHRALRLWVYNNPGMVRRKFSGAAAQTEVLLDSADRVDVVFKMPDRVVAVEVKARDSNLFDLRRGVFQCIKYRAVLDAMDIREAGPVSAVLVTEMEVPGDIRALLKRHGISHFQAPMDRT